MNAAEFSAAVEAMSRDLEAAPLTEAMERCHDHVAGGIRDCFQEGIGPDGEIWPKRVDKATHSLLRKSGALEAAWTEEGAPGHVKRIGYREMQIGVQKAAEGSLAGAMVHQYGATIYPKVKKFLVFMLEGIGLVFAKKVTIPARPVGPTDEAIGNCRAEIGDAVRAEVFRR